ncbi:MAG: metallophosphoesterase family protein [Candidatus Woesearchaeota archaeon]
MKRTKHKNKPSAIITADWHLRESIPVCRTDDFWAAQHDKVVWISELQKELGCPIIHAGDLFDHWKASPILLSLFLANFPLDTSHDYEPQTSFWSIYGNHDLPMHSLDLRGKSGLYTLETAGAVQILNGYHWQQTPTDHFSITLGKPGRRVLVWHVMTYQGKEPWPGCTDTPAKELLKQYPDADLIVTGHNHKSFVEEYEGRLLVNPGSITRQTADQVDHEPCIYLWYAESNTVEKKIIPHQKGVISREHIERKQEKEARYEAFIQRLKQEGDPELSFRKNLEKFFQQNKVVKSVRNLIYEKLEVKNG